MQSCVYEIYGSTDLASVLAYAGLPDGTDVSDLSTPKTLDPENVSQAQIDCLARAEAEFSVCADDAGDVERVTKSCVDFWEGFDAVGCADAWLAWIHCITDNAGDIDCQTGEVPTCDVSANAYFQCSSAFTSATMCSQAGDPAALCGDEGGTYSFGCLGTAAPFADCTEVPTDAAGVTMYCCF